MSWRRARPSLPVGQSQARRLHPRIPRSPRTGRPRHCQSGQSPRSLHAGHPLHPIGRVAPADHAGSSLPIPLPAGVRVPRRGGLRLEERRGRFGANLLGLRPAIRQPVGRSMTACDWNYPSMGCTPPGATISAGKTWVFLPTKWCSYEQAVWLGTTFRPPTRSGCSFLPHRCWKGETWGNLSSGRGEFCFNFTNNPDLPHPSINKP